MQSRMRVFVFILALALLIPFACKQKEAEHAVKQGFVKIDVVQQLCGAVFQARTVWPQQDQCQGAQQRNQHHTDCVGQPKGPMVDV